MATAYLMSGGTTYVTFTPTGGVGYSGDVYLNAGASSVVSGTYKCTYNCPSGSTVSCTAYRWWGGGTVCDGYFEVGSQSVLIPTSITTQSFPASNNTSIGFSLTLNTWGSEWWGGGSGGVSIVNPTIYVTYTPKYTLTVRADTGISSVTGGGTYNEGASTQIRATVATGYTWSKWVYTSGGSQYTATQNPTITVNSNIDLTARATANTFTIAYNNNGGTGTMSTTTATYGQYVTLRANTFTKSKYIFKGWATSSTGSKVYDNQQQILASNLYTSKGATITLYAVWEEDPNAVFVNFTKVYSNGWK